MFLRVVKRNFNWFCYGNYCELKWSGLRNWRIRSIVGFDVVISKKCSVKSYFNRKY